MITTIVHREVKDPRPLLYFYPNMPAQRYAQLIAAYHNEEKLHLAESVAHSFGGILVPSSCLHWKFKQKYADRKVQVGYQTYYALKREEMTEGAYQKFSDFVDRLHSQEVAK